jgi:hypothetical protein
MEAEDQEQGLVVAACNGFIQEKNLSAEQAAEAVKVLMKVSSYTGAKSHSVDEF